MTLPLPAELKRRIGDFGPVRFDHFMQTALYHPEHGYYSSGRGRTGTRGDFLTPVTTGPVLGQLLASQADEWHAALGRPASVCLGEQGADRGWLACDILDSISSQYPALRSALHLHIIEPSPRLVEQQESTLALHRKTFPISWHRQSITFSPGDVPCFFYSCELVDSFPVRLARHLQGEWHELWVDVREGKLHWSAQPAPADLMDEVKRWDIPSVDGFTAEIRPDAGPWIRSLGQIIRRGIILTLDYGMPAAELYHLSRSAGTLVSLRSHQRTPDPLQDPGEQDLTSHVNYTDLILEGKKEGLETLGLADFSSAWTRLAQPLLTGSDPLPQKWSRNFQHLTHPGFFGKTHQVLVQGKNLPRDFQPSLLKPVTFGSDLEDSVALPRA